MEHIFCHFTFSIVRVLHTEYMFNMSECFKNVEEKCIACSVKHIYNVTKWSGYFCFQIGCKHSRINKTVSFSKKDIPITVFFCILVLFSVVDSIVSIIHNKDGGNGTFFMFLFMISNDIAILICITTFLIQTKIAKDALIQPFDIINDILFGISIYWNKRQLKIYEYKSLFLCLFCIFSITIVVLFYSLYGSNPYISFVQEISIYVISYYYLF